MDDIPKFDPSKAAIEDFDPEFAEVEARLRKFDELQS